MYDDRETSKVGLIILIIFGVACLLHLWWNSGNKSNFLDFINSSW